MPRLPTNRRPPRRGKHDMRLHGADSGYGDEMNDELDLTEWLNSTAESRERLLTYSRSSIPTDPGARQLDVSEALALGQDAGDLLADSESYLSQAFAAAVLDARISHDAQTARIVAKSKTAKLERLREGLAVLYQTIKDRRFALMNLNRA